MADTRYPNVIPAKAGIQSNLSESLVGYLHRGDESGLLVAAASGDQRATSMLPMN
jgi:hypothetical protein